MAEREDDVLQSGVLDWCWAGPPGGLLRPAVVRDGWTGGRLAALRLAGGELEVS